MSSRALDIFFQRKKITWKYMEIKHENNKNKQVNDLKLNQENQHKLYKKNWIREKRQVFRRNARTMLCLMSRVSSVIRRSSLSITKWAGRISKERFHLESPKLAWHSNRPNLQLYPIWRRLLLPVGCRLDKNTGYECQNHVPGPHMVLTN